MINRVDVQAIKIASVNLHAGQAEITRIFQVNIKAGDNRISILGLHSDLLQDSVRVQGQGKASIVDVVSSKTPANRDILPNSHPLIRKRLEVLNAHESALEARRALKSYLASTNAKDVHMEDLDAMLDKYTTLTAKVDSQILNLGAELAELDKEIHKAEKPDQNAGKYQVSILVSADTDEDIELVIKYAVLNADWTPAYDIWVDTQAKGNNIAITYKALISQSTGEDWKDCRLTLDTAIPSFAGIPHSIMPWNLSIRAPPQSYYSRPYERDRRFSRSSSRSHSPIRQPQMPAPTVFVSSDKSAISATFQIPGLVDIPSDGQRHHVTIAKMTVTSKVLWYAIPKTDTKTYLKAVIKNESEYYFVAGHASIFVDGSFVAAVSLPAVNPQETFECPLGVDPFVRIIYHTREKKASLSGLVARILTQSFTQRITIQNTKSVAVDIKLLDNIPVSQDDSIQVKLIQPSLPATGQSASRKIVNSGSVFAQWAGADDDALPDQAVGTDGKFNWILQIPPMKKMNMVLQFDVSAPTGTHIYGL